MSHSFLTLKLYTNPARLHGTSQVSKLTSSLEYDLLEPSHVDQNNKTHVVQNSLIKARIPFRCRAPFYCVINKTIYAIVIRPFSLDMLGMNMVPLC